mmetsp:Transcript_26257/g.79720  ORF Transcript_26257/g.79720 Transcript_26257/m.79720 type:complete len:90 (+) Transcript_26257:581-850(+)
MSSIYLNSDVASPPPTPPGRCCRGFGVPKSRSECIGFFPCKQGAFKLRLCRESGSHGPFNLAVGDGFISDHLVLLRLLYSKCIGFLSCT